jgi:hypothetical protein
MLQPIKCDNQLVNHKTWAKTSRLCSSHLNHNSMQAIVIETHNDATVEWGISLTDHNPTQDNYLPMPDRETAFKVADLLIRKV